MPDILTLLLIGLAAYGFTWLGVRLIRPYAGQIYRTENGESVITSRPSDVPRGGGLVILVVVLLMFLPLGLWVADPPPVVRLALAGAMIAMIGFFDDLRTLPRPLRIGAQILAALIFVPYAPITVLDLPAWTQVVSVTIGLIISLCWVVGLSNTYSYMDNVDGLAAGQAALVAVIWAYLGWVEGNRLVAVFSLLIAGSSLGFLAHNIPPARIFMGEVGSTFIGFSLAALPLLMAQSSPRLFISGVLFVGLFVFDAVLTAVIYVLRGRYRHHPKRSHLYQRMLALGDAPTKVTLIYLLLSVGFAAAGILYWTQRAWVALVVVALLCLFLYSWIKRREISRSG